MTLITLLLNVTATYSEAPNNVYLVPNKPGDVGSLSV